MKQVLTSLRNSGRLRLYYLLIISAIISAATLVLRMKLAGNANYIFLIWNLFLAAIPLGLAITITNSKIIQSSKISLGIGLFAWLIFFPNSPYLMTDILHFKYGYTERAWLDVFMLMMFSWTGLITGFVSLSEIQHTLSKKFSSTTSTIFVLFSLILGSFGVYIGRFLRWNSWDILRNPTELARDILDIVLSPSHHPRTYAVTIVLSAFMIIAYFTIMQIQKVNRQSE